MLPTEEDLVYFFPERGEKARITIEVTTASDFGARLLDQEGKPLRILVELHRIGPGTYSAEWDGLLEHRIPARYNMAYTIQVFANGETLYRKAVAKTLR